ncbi:fam-c protein, partial [Plasmodium chabaudi adami]
MNKKIYCLVTVVSYILLVVTIQCFTNNDDLNKYVKKNKNIHDKYEINSIDINNNEAFKYRSLSECNVEDDYTLGSSTIKEPSDNKKTETTSNIKKPKRLKFFNIFKRDNKNKKHKAPSHSKVRIPYPYDQITEAPLDYGRFLPRITITMENVAHEYIPRTSKDLRYLLRVKKKLEKKIEYKSEYKLEYETEYKSEYKSENKSE